MRVIREFYWILLFFSFLIIGSLITYYPHLEYPYPIHVDEWEHFAMAEEITITGRLPGYFPVFKDHPDAGTMKWERNYHTLLAIFFLVLPFPHEFTMTIVPVVIYVLMFMSVYLLLFHLTKSKYISIFGGFLMSLIKSNITTLGPWFAVPAAAGLAFMPFLLFLLLNTFHRDRFMLLIFSGLTLASVALMNPHIVIIVPVFALYLLSKPHLILRKIKEIFVAIIILLIILVVFIPSFLTNPQSGLQQLMSFFSFGQEMVEIKFNVLSYVGYIPFVFSIIGLFFALRAYRKKEMVLACFFALLAVLIYIYTNYDIMFFILYRRAFMFLVESILLLSMFAIFSISNVINREKLGYIICLALFALVLFEPITSFTLYSNLLKHYVSDENYQDILWMKENLPGDAVVLATPEVSSAIYPIAHRYVADYAFSPKEELARLLQNPCSYESVRVLYEVTHVYKPGTVCSRLSLMNNSIYKYN